MAAGPFTVFLRVSNSLPVSPTHHSKTTAFKTKIVEERKTHDYKMQQLNNEHAQKMKDVEQEYLLEERRLLAQVSRQPHGMASPICQGSRRPI